MCSYSTVFWKNLGPARKVLERLRRRDLFCFAGEVILSPQQRAELQQKLNDRRAIAKAPTNLIGDIGLEVKREMLQLLSLSNDKNGFIFIHH